jgi:hypothetical protein
MCQESVKMLDEKRLHYFHLSEIAISLERIDGGRNSTWIIRGWRNSVKKTEVNL